MEKEKIEARSKESRKRFRAAQLGGWLSICVNLGVFSLKILLGLLTNSLLLKADAWHTLTDSITSVIVLVGSWISRKPADKDHPYGHGRAELIATLLIGVILLFISADFLSDAAIRLSKGHQPESLNSMASIIIIAIVITIMIKLGMGIFAMRLGKKYDLSSLQADAQHHYSDAISSLGVLAGLGLTMIFEIWWIDAFLSGVIAIYIAYTAYRILNDASDLLLGRNTDRKVLTTVDGICREADAEYGVELGPHHYHLHSYGEHKELTFHVLLPREWAIGRGHDLIEELEERIRDQLGIESTIHIDPGVKDKDES